MKKIMLAIILIFLIFLSTGFDDIIRGRTEIENLYSITAGGVDKNNDNNSDEYLVTTLSPTTEEEAIKPTNIMTASGKTVFEANRLLGLYSEKDIFWGHNKYILVGEEAAKDDVFKYLDFFMRDQEVRLSATPLVIRGTTAQKFISSQYEQNINIPSNLDNIIENLNLESYSSQLDMIQFINLTYESKNGYLPYIELEKESKDFFIEQGSEPVEQNHGQLQEKQNNIPSESEIFSNDVAAHIPGYALIKKGKVIDYMEDETARGLSWMINKVVSGTIVITLDGKKINLEIITGKCDMTPKIENEKLSAEINVKVSSNISEIDEMNVVVDNHFLKSLKDAQKRHVQKEIEDALKILQGYEIDIIGLGDKFYHKYPLKWDEYKEDWEKIFGDIDITVEVESDIERSYKFKSSVYFKEAD